MALVSTKPPSTAVEFGAEDLSQSDEHDEIVDLTDRRRVLVRLLFGVDVGDADPVFESASS